MVFGRDKKAQSPYQDHSRFLELGHSFGSWLDFVEERLELNPQSNNLQFKTRKLDE
jgi:hypothetical protein